MTLGTLLGPPKQETAPPSSSPDKLAALPRIFGDYELISELAHGGMGMVYRARQLSLGRTVAVKMIRAGLLADDEAVRRFRAEAETAASLDHPNIVPIYQIGEHAGQQYFSMKLIEGRSLAACVAGGGRMKENRDERTEAAFHPVKTLGLAGAAALLAKVARAIHHAHQRGILHRDLKPGNILLDAQGEPHVTDFGLAKLLSEDAQSLAINPQLTLTGAILGTPAYMSPEQVAGKSRQLTTAADIYSLGAILYELLTGKPPFAAETPLATMRQVMDEEPARPSSINRLTDRDLETICLKCLEKEPARRYRSAEALAEDLERWLRHEPISVRRSTLAEHAAKWIKRHPARAAVILAFGVVVLLGAGAVLWEWRDAVKSRRETESALRTSQDALWQANFDRARALRTSRQMGQRVEALKAIRAAAKIRPTPELRTEAIAAMALVDLEDLGVWLHPPSNGTVVGFNRTFDKFVVRREDTALEVRRVSDGQLLAVIPNGQPNAEVSFTDSGELLFTGDQKQCRVWDWQRTNLLCECPSRPDNDRAAISPDGRWLAYNQTNFSVAVKDVLTGRQVALLEGFKSRAVAMCFSSDGEFLALVEDGRNVQVWRMADGVRIALTTELQVNSLGMSFIPGQPLLAIGAGDGSLYVWDFATGRLEKLGSKMTDGVYPFSHPGGNLLASDSWDLTLRLWDPYSGVQLMETKSAKPVQPYAFSPDGQWMLASRARGWLRLQVQTAPECRLVHLPIGLGQWLRNMAFSPDDRFLAGVSDEPGGKGLWIWDVASGRRIAYQALTDANGISFVDNQSLLTSSAEGVLLWTNAQPGTSWVSMRQSLVLAPDGRDFGGVSLSADGKQIVVRRDGTNQEFDYPSLRLRLTLEGQPLSGPAEFSRDGRWLASGYWDNTGTHRSQFWIWSAEDGRPVRKMAAGNCWPLFSPDGRWLVVAADKEFSQYALEGPPAQWPLVRRYERETTGFGAGYAAFSADGKVLALQVDDRVFALVEAATGRELARLTTPPHVAATVRAGFSHNGRWFVTHSEQGVHVWDLQLIRSHLREMNLDWDGPPDLP